jgi:hypothetical protein
LEKKGKRKIEFFLIPIPLLLFLKREMEREKRQKKE